MKLVYITLNTSTGKSIPANSKLRVTHIAVILCQQYSKQERCKRRFNSQLFVWINTFLHQRNKAYIALNLHEGT